jgi:site-specific DNA-methyltransferase (adenine-specific)
MNGLREMPDKCIDLCIVDPPYGIGKGIFEPVGGRKGKNSDNKKWDTNIPNTKYFEELFRISKEQIIWGANYFNCFNGNHGAIVWDKTQPLPDSSQCEIASYSRLTKVGLYRQTWTNFVNTRETDHPTEKPIALYKWLLKNYAKEGDLILDTHVGSASSLIACEDMGFDYVGYELDKEYYDNAVKRITQYRSQLKLAI